MKRIVGLALLAIVGLVEFGRVDRVRAEELIRVGNSAPVSFFFEPLQIGMEKGIFAKHGLNVERADFFGARGPQAIAAGSIDINLGSGVELAFGLKGAPEIGIAQVANRPGLLTVIVPQDSPIRSIADLHGKSLGVTTAGSLTEWIGHEMARRQGWGTDGISVRALGPDTTQLAVMRSGQLDSMLIDVASAYRLEAAGEARILLRVADVIPDFIIHIIFASKPFLQEKPAAVCEFLAGWFDTVAYMADHKQETTSISAKDLGIAPEIAARTYEELMPMFSRTGRLSESGLKVLAQSLVDMGTVAALPDMKPLYDESFLPAAAR